MRCVTTCIVGISYRGKVWIGGDSSLSGEGQCTIRSASPKVWKAGPYLIGFAGDGDAYSAIFGNLDPRPPRGDLDRWMHSDFTTLIKDAIERHPRIEGEEPLSWSLLIGVDGRIFVLDDYGMNRVYKKYCAIGSAAGPAFGVLFATPGLPPKQRIELALEAAFEHEDAVRKPWKILSI